jgi:hypothetical protein
VNIRATNENKAALQVLSEIAEEMVISANTIRSALANNAIALNTWIATEQGYMYVFSILFCNVHIHPPKVTGI